MRLWSLHPKYLDAKGLVALWREGLLALHVLQGKTKGYRNHPQLARFQSCHNPVATLHSYLCAVLAEAVARDYHFDASKICESKASQIVSVTQGQMAYEFLHLKKKLWQRDRKRFAAIQNLKKIEPNPILKIVSGDIESWERVL